VSATPVGVALGGAVLVDGLTLKGVAPPTVGETWGAATEVATGEPLGVWHAVTEVMTAAVISAIAKVRVDICPL
jgi:hypothetical protein